MGCRRLSLHAITIIIIVIRVCDSTIYQAGRYIRRYVYSDWNDVVDDDVIK